MPKIGSKRDIPSFPRTTDEEPPKKAIKKEMPVSADKCSQQKSFFERTVSSTSESGSDMDSSSTSVESSSETDSTSTAYESSIEIDPSSTTSDSSSETDSSSTILDSSSETDSSSTTSDSSSETDSSSTTSDSSSETDSSSTTSDSSSETDSSSTTSDSSSETDSSSTTSKINNIPIYMLSSGQLLDRFNFLLSKNQNLTGFKIQGTPTKSEFNKTYKKLLLKIHPDKVGHEYEEFFKSIYPICQELLKKLK